MNPDTQVDDEKKPGGVEMYAQQLTGAK